MDLLWKYGFLWISLDFVWTLLDFSMELTKVCVELVWRLCFGVEFVWILNFGFIPTFGIDCRMVLCRVFGMFCAVFVACFVASIGRIMWPVDKSCSGMVSGQNWRVLELPRISLARWCLEATLLRGWAQNYSSLACSCVARLKNYSPRVRNCVETHAIA